VIHGGCPRFSRYLEKVERTPVHPRSTKCTHLEGACAPGPGDVALQERFEIVRAHPFGNLGPVLWTPHTRAYYDPLGHS
jgi:hypothetical protein